MLKTENSREGRRLLGLARALGRDLIVFDLEHTGGSYDTFGMLEIGCLCVRSDGRIEKFETLINPERSIPPMISRITNIHPAMVKAKPIWQKAAASFVLDNQEAVWIGFNSKASDVKRIRSLHQKLGLPVPAFRHQIDLMLLGRRMGGHTGKLSELAAIHAPSSVTKAHRAYADAVMTAGLLGAWLEYALDNLDSIFEPVGADDALPTAQVAAKAKNLKAKAQRQGKSGKGVALTSAGGNHGKRWNDDDLDIIHAAVVSGEVDVKVLSDRLQRSAFAIALKAVSFGHQDQDWAERFKAQIAA